VKELEFLFPGVEFDTLGVVVGMKARYTAYSDGTIVLLVSTLVLTHPNNIIIIRLIIGSFLRKEKLIGADRASDRRSEQHAYCLRDRRSSISRQLVPCLWARHSECTGAEVRGGGADHPNNTRSNSSDVSLAKQRA